MATLMQIMTAISAERRFQDEKYGTVLEGSVSYDPDPIPGPLIRGPGGHDLAAWLIVIEKELNEAKDAATGSGPTARMGTRHSVRSELVQIAAVCVAALEQHGLEE